MASGCVSEGHGKNMSAPWITKADGSIFAGRIFVAAKIMFHSLNQQHQQHYF